MFVFAGLINLYSGLFTKFDLWSFKVMNASFCASCSILSSILSFSAISFASLLIFTVAETSALRYADVMLSVMSFL